MDFEPSAQVISSAEPFIHSHSLSLTYHLLPLFSYLGKQFIQVKEALQEREGIDVSQM